MRQRIPARIKENKHGTNAMPGRDRQELVDPLLEAGRIVLPEQVMEKHTHGIHTHGFSPGGLGVNLSGIEGRLLPHLQLIEGGLGNVIAPDQPRLSRVPGIRFLLRPVCVHPTVLHRQAAISATVINADLMLFTVFTCLEILILA
jgi:hypothetical protein